MVFGTLTLGLTACGALLDLPDPTVDDNYGSGDGSITLPDGQIILPDGAIVDGALGDGFVPPHDGGGANDGQSTSDGASCNGKNCFGGGCSKSNECLPATLSTTIADPGAIAFDGTSVVYVLSGSDTVAAVDYDQHTTTMSTGEPNLTAIAASSAGVVFASSGTEKLTHCTGVSCAGTSKQNLIGLGASFDIYGIVMNATNAFVSQDASGANGKVFSCAFTGGGCTALTAAGTPTLIDLDSTSLYWIGGVTPSGFYTISTSAGGSVAGSNAQLDVTAFKIFDSILYFATPTVISHVVEPGTGLAVQLNNQQHSVVAIGVDATNVYWIDVQALVGTLYSCGRISCGTPTPLVMGLDDPAPQSLVVTSDSLIYTTRGSTNKVWRLAK